MKVFPTAYMPSMEYLVCCKAAVQILIEQEETYPKQTLRNRCYVATSQGVQPLIVPVSKPNGNNTKTKEIKILDTSFKKHHLKTLKSVYKSSAFYDYYYDIVEDIIMFQTESLIEYNFHALKTFFKLLNISTSMDFNNKFEQEPESSDLRILLSKKNSYNSFQIIETYEKYSQVFEDKIGFVPNLSVLDLIFNAGPQSGTVINCIYENNFDSSLLGLFSFKS